MSRYHYGIEGKHHYWRMFLMMIWNCLLLVAISIFFSFEVQGGGVVVAAFGIISNIQTPTHHYQRSTSTSASASIHLGQRTPRTSTILNYQQNDEDDDTSIHETVMELDPLWYQEYVTDILGKDYCKSKWPILPKEKKGSNADELSEVALSPEIDVSDTKQETIEAEKPKLIEEEDDQTIQPLVTTLEVQEESQTKLEEDELEVKEANLTEKESITLDNGDGNQSIELEATSEEERDQESDETEEVLTPKSTGDSSEERKGSVDSLMESTWKGMTQNVFGGGGSSSKDTNEDKMEVKAVDIKETTAPQSHLDQQTPKTEQKLKEPAATVPNTTATVKGEIPSTEIVAGKINKTSDDDSKDDNALSNKKSIDDECKDNDDDGDDDVDDGRVVLYRTFGGRVNSFPLSNLINLGYRPEEIEQMESDALYVIIQDKVKRPRFGVPSQWKIQPGQRPEVKLVAKKNKESREEEEFDLKENERQQKQDEDPTRKRRPVAAQGRRTPPESTTRISKSSSDDDRIASKKTIQEVTPARDNLVEETASKANNKDDIPEPEVKTVDSAADSIGAAAKNESIVIYRNIAGNLTTASLQSLTDLGYKEEEVLSMISDALAVVVADNVPRPRKGVPPQWKVPTGAQLEDVQIVENMNRAKTVLEADRAEKRRRKAVENESIVGKPRRRRSSAEVDLDEANDGYNSRRRRDPDQGRRSSSRRGDYPSKSVIASDEDESVTRSRRVPSDNEDVEDDVLDGSAQRRKRSRERNRSIDDDVDRRREPDAAPGGARWRNEVSEDDREKSRGEIRRSRRRQRSSINPDGTPKKIYNAREQLGRKNLPVKADPPNPNSRLWVDIDTFRDLLRTEAKLRLMFLPESWASTVKQESDWRLNLYKDWLWALHDGVGESIVPPSRYERARRAARFRTDDEEEMRSASPRPKQRRRKPPPQKTKSRSGDRY